MLLNIRLPGKDSVLQFDHRKRLVIASLLITFVGVQLATVGYYTIFYRVSSVSVRNELRATTSPTYGHRHTTTPPYKWVIEDNDGMNRLLDLTDNDLLAAREALRTVGNRSCFVEGLKDSNDMTVSAGGCWCKADWFGPACSVPGFIMRSSTPWSKDSLRLRSQPRRIINAFPFNAEIEMAELRFAELAEVVDVFLILESNYTMYGTPKKLHILERLRNGTYPNVAGKVVHVFLNYFPQKAYQDGWISDDLHRNYLGTHGLRRLGGLRPDDLVVLTDADEIPRRQLMSFLKWHDGYSEPVLINYQWSVYGFFWGVPAGNGVRKTQETIAVITVGMAVYVFRYQLYFIRSAPKFIRNHAFSIQVIVIVSNSHRRTGPILL